MNLKLLVVVLLMLIGTANAVSVPAIILTFDDFGLAIGSDYIEQVLTENGQRGVVFVITGRPSNVTQLVGLQDKGWDVGSHTVTHAHLTTTTDLDYELQGSHDWLVQNGLNGADFIAYPFGEYNSNVLTKTATIYTYGRTVSNGVNLEGFDHYKLKRLLSSNRGTSVSAHKTAIDSVIAQNGIGILVFHGIGVGNTDTYVYDLDGFKEISDYIKSTGVNVITFSDLDTIEFPDPSPTPTPTPTSPPPIPNIIDGENVIKNPYFNNLSDWKKYGVGFTLSSGMGLVTVSTVGTNMQLYQYDIHLEPNVMYRLSFDAYSNTGHDLTVYLHKHLTPYTSYGLSKMFDLGTSKQTFTTEFVTNGFINNVTDGRIRFWLPPYGKSGDKYYIDNVVLKRV